MVDLALDIIEDILLRLSVKTLSRFKCVCSPWYSLISNSDFVKRHLNVANQSNNLYLLLRYTFPSIDYHTLSYDDELQLVPHYNLPPIHHPLDGTRATASDTSVEIIGSCDGLICLSYSYAYGAGVALYLWNPTTNQRKTLPALPTVRNQDALYGFGYDPISQDYKLIYCFPIVEDFSRLFYNEYEVNVYTLQTDTWSTQIKPFPNYYFTMRRSTGVHLNCAIHWIGTDTDDWRTWSDEYIVSVGIADEEVKEVPTPETSIWFCRHTKTLGVLGGLLCFSKRIDEVQLQLWVMKEYGVKDSWTIQFTILETHCLPPSQHFKPVCFSKRGEILFGYDDGLFLYDPQREKGRILIC